MPVEARSLETLVQQARDLPALPNVVVQVMRLTDDPRASAADVARVLATDQAMTARLLRLANSAFYGAMRRVSTVTEAVVMLGMRTVRNLAMALGCQEMLEAPLPGYALPVGGLWRGSLAGACAAQTLAARAHYRAAEEAFVGALLRDIGKVILNIHLQAQFSEVRRRAETGDMDFLTAEREVLGFDHAEAGARVLEKWNLPPQIVACAHYHHAPLAQADMTPLVGIVHVADAICLTLGIGVGGDGLNYALQEEVLDRLRLTAADYEEVAAQVCDMMADSDAAF